MQISGFADWFWDEHFIPHRPEDDNSISAEENFRAAQRQEEGADLFAVHECVVEEGA